MNEKSADLLHCADRDSYFPAAQHVPFLKEHMCYVVTARFHDQSLDPPDLAVGRADSQFAAYVNLVRRDEVDGDLLWGFWSARQAPIVPQHSELRKKGRATGRVYVPRRVQVRHDLSLLRGLKRPELRLGAAEPELIRRGIDKVNGDKPPCATPVLLFDYEMSDLLRDRVEDYAAHLTAGSIAAAGVGPDPE